MGVVGSSSPLFLSLVYNANTTFDFRYLLEHGLKQDGRPDPDASSTGELSSFETFFTETG